MRVSRGVRSSVYRAFPRNGRSLPADLTLLLTTKGGALRTLKGPQHIYSAATGQVPDGLGGVQSSAIPPVTADGFYAGPAYTNLFTTSLVETFGFNALAAETISGQVSTKSGSDKVTVDWGDGTYSEYAGTDVGWTHTYATGGVKRCRFLTSDHTVLKKFTQTNSSSHLGGSLSLPSSITYFNCEGNSNTFSGSLSLPSSVTAFYCNGNLNTFSGSLSLPSSVAYFNCGGNLNTFSGSLSLSSSIIQFSCWGNLNTFSGSLSLPSALTSFNCEGVSNTFSGSLSLPSALTSFSCGSVSNTFSGSLSLPSALTYFNCWGSSNTFSGSLSLPSTLTYFSCGSNLNTFSGSLSLPSSITYFNCGGNSNTFSGYTQGAKANNFRYFYINGAAMSLTATDVDNMLIDFAGVTTWASEKTLYIQGNAPNRTSASNAAYIILQGKGLTTLSVD